MVSLTTVILIKNITSIILHLHLAVRNIRRTLWIEIIKIKKLRLQRRQPTPLLTEITSTSRLVTTVRKLSMPLSMKMMVISLVFLATRLENLGLLSRQEIYPILGLSTIFYSRFYFDRKYSVSADSPSEYEENNILVSDDHHDAGEIITEESYLPDIEGYPYHTDRFPL